MLKNVGQHFFVENMLFIRPTSIANGANMLANNCWWRYWPTCWHGLRPTLDSLLLWIVHLKSTFGMFEDSNIEEVYY